MSFTSGKSPSPELGKYYRVDSEELHKYVKTKRNLRTVPCKIKGTVSEFDGVAVVYWGTPVIACTNYRTFAVLNSGGFRSATTKKHMNSVLRILGFRQRVKQENFEWYVLWHSLYNPEVRKDRFEDGMVCLHSAGVVSPEEQRMEVIV